jgi:trehalose 6-phosphate synthase/phosphatase
MRLLVVSNRLPVTVTINGVSPKLSPSSGGLVSAINAYLEKNNNYLWIGWPGTEVKPNLFEKVSAEVLQHKNIPVFLPQKLIETFYEGFCNKTIWPLFHYFVTFSIFEDLLWQDYIRVNQAFADTIIEQYQEGDIIWIHDYQLMLVPQMVRSKLPQASIGFFLHIPFPSFEVFRVLPREWREQLLEGLLGADLIGFHTHEYTQNFLRSVLRILGFEHFVGKIRYHDRAISVQTFPLGIDFDKFQQTARSRAVQDYQKHLKEVFGDKKIILSIDRLDYTKGVSSRLAGFDMFLNRYPEWRKKVILTHISIPSRVGVDQYQRMKRLMEEQVGRINGKYGTIDWTPISYQFDSVPFEQLVGLYKQSDIALVTPLRDGMNLIAKEYIASKTDGTGVLILSEFAGAVKEMSETITVNPYSISEIAKTIHLALEMPKSKQKQINASLQKKLKNNNVTYWAKHFIDNLKLVKDQQSSAQTKYLSGKFVDRLASNYKNAHRRLLIFDYDGTLVDFADTPHGAKPGKKLLELLQTMAEDKSNEVVICSGRDRETMEKWFGHIPLSLCAEHGLVVKQKWSNWKVMIETINSPKSWQSEAVRLLSQYVEQVPGSFVEQKEYSLAWHYRKADPEIADIRSKELLDDLVSFILNKDLYILSGNKVIELKYSTMNKGVAILPFAKKEHYDFVLAAGSDRSEDDIFEALPTSAWTIHVGSSPSKARYNVSDVNGFRDVLKQIMSKKGKQ